MNTATTPAPPAGTHRIDTDPPVAQPRLPLRWWGLGIRFAVAVAMLFGLNFLSPLAFMPLYSAFEHDEGVLFLLETVRYAFVLAATVGLVTLWMRLIERKRLRDAGWVVNARAFGWLLAGVGIAGAIMALLFAIRSVTGLPIFESNESFSGMIASAPLWAVLLILFGMAFLSQGIPEELLFRGWLFNIVVHRPWLAFWWTTATFTIIHLLSDGGQQYWYDYLAYLAIPFGFGALAGSLVLLTGSMWIAAGIHSGFHASHYSIVLLTGQAFNPAAWANLAIGAAFLVPTVLVLLVWHRRRTREG